MANEKFENKTEGELINLLAEKEEEINRLQERIEADRNAIMQIQFEAKQHKQEELDLHETQIWRTGLRIEKILQKTGVAFIRSLLELSDYKRMGMMITLRKGLNEALHRENVEKKKKRRMQLCSQKFRRYKKWRDETIPCNIENISAPQEEGLVTVVLPVYNGEKTLRKSVESVLSQTYNNLELIIVDDGSWDNTPEIVEEYRKKDSRIRVITQENKKLPTALSVGFREAKGEFLTWTSADNIMLPDCLSTMVDDLKKYPEYSMVYGNMRLIGPSGKIKRGHFWFEKPLFSGNVILPSNTDFLNTFANNTIGAAFMYRRAAAEILGDYSKYKTNLEDYDYWMRMNSLLKIKHTDTEKPIYLYRIHEDSLTAHDKELGITKNRYKLMVLDDLRRDFYMSNLVWIVEGEEDYTSQMNEFMSRATALGHTILTRSQAIEACPAKDYSLFCYIYFGKNPHSEKVAQMQCYSGTVLVSPDANAQNADMFDICVSMGKGHLPNLGGHKGWFGAKDINTLFDLAETKIKNNILYSLEGVIDEPPECERKLSIIICTYLRGEKLIDAIWSVIRQSMSKKEYEIIIVDNAPFSSGIKEDVDDFCQKYSEFEGFIRYIGVPQKGLSYARNAGLWNAKGEYLLFLDDDVLADYYVLEEIYSAYKYHPDMGVVGGQVILDKPFPTPKVVRKGWESLWSQFKISGSTFREATQQFEFPYGACFSVRRSAIWQIGGFRMCYGRVGNDFAGGEETAVSFKMREIGYGVGLQPRAKVLHRVDHSRFTTEHVKKTIMAGTLTTYRFFIDLHTNFGWTKRYAKNQISITKGEIRRLQQKDAENLDIYYKKCYLAAWERLLDYIKESQED